MSNELISAREILHVGESSRAEHSRADEHHSAEDWRAFFHSLEHRTAFESGTHWQLKHQTRR